MLVGHTCANRDRGQKDSRKYEWADGARQLIVSDVEETSADVDIVVEQ